MALSVFDAWLLKVADESGLKVCIVEVGELKRNGLYGEYKAYMSKLHESC